MGTHTQGYLKTLALACCAWWLLDAPQKGEHVPDANQQTETKHMGSIWNSNMLAA